MPPPILIPFLCQARGSTGLASVSPCSPDTSDHRCCAKALPGEASLFPWGRQLKHGGVWETSLLPNPAQASDHPQALTDKIEGRHEGRGIPGKRCHSKAVSTGLGGDLPFGKCRPGNTMARSCFKLPGGSVDTEMSLKSCMRHQTQGRAWVLQSRKVPLGDPGQSRV